MEVTSETGKPVPGGQEYVSDCYEIACTAKPAPVKIKYSAILEVHRAVQSRESDVAAVLLGSGPQDAITIEGCQILVPVSPAELPKAAVAAFQFRLRHPFHDGKVRPIGFLRTQATGFLEVSALDRDICKRTLSATGGVFLLVRRSAHRAWSGTLYIWNPGEAHECSPGVDFPFDEYFLRNGYGEVAAPSETPFVSKRPAWKAALLIGVMLAAVSGLGVHWFDARHREPPHAQADAFVLESAQQLGLRVVRKGDQTEVTWDRLSPAILAAQRGSLTIRDGTLERALELNREQLRNGRIVYGPSFGDLEFRLVVFGKERGTETESVQLLGGLLPRALAPADATKQPNETLSTSQSNQPAATQPASSDPLAPKTQPIIGHDFDVQPGPQTQPSNRDTSRMFVATAKVAPSRPPVVVIETPPAIESESLNAIALPKVSAGDGFPGPSTKSPATKDSGVAVQRSDASVVQPEVLQRVTPKLPRSKLVSFGAMDVVVLAKISDKGKVTHAEFIDRPSPVSPEISSAILLAVLEWQFRPARLHGKPVSSVYEIHFHMAAN